MLFSIDPSNGLAIYDQIVRNMTFAIANEAILPGELVPSVRELSRQLAVNPNTVARAYRDLQALGVLSSLRGTGLEVSADAPTQCRKERLKLLRERIRYVLTEASQSGLELTKLRTLVEEEISKLEKQGAVR